jgi:hypothetical protein
MEDFEKSLNEKLDFILNKNTDHAQQYELGNEIEDMSQDNVISYIRKLNGDISSTLSIMSAHSPEDPDAIDDKLERVCLAAKKLLYEQTNALHKLSMKLLVDEEY